MRLSRFVGFLLVLLSGAAGCGGSLAPVPSADDVARIRLSVRRVPAGVAAKAPAEVTLTARPDITEVIDWLLAFDWSQSGMDLKAVRMAEPDGGIVITTKDGASQDYSFYWDGGLIITKANRLIRGGDVARLRQLVQRVCN
jgi:hypothetical protein